MSDITDEIIEQAGEGITHALSHLNARLDGAFSRISAVEGKVTGIDREHMNNQDERIGNLARRLETLEKHPINDERVIHLRNQVERSAARIASLDYKLELLRGGFADLGGQVESLENREAPRAEKAVFESIKPAGKHVYLLEGMDGERVDEVIGTYSTMLDAMEFVARWNGANPSLADHSWFANESSRQWINGRWRITELSHDSKFWDGDDES